MTAAPWLVTGGRVNQELEVWHDSSFNWKLTLAQKLRNDFLAVEELPKLHLFLDKRIESRREATLMDEKSDDCLTNEWPGVELCSVPSPSDFGPN